MAVKVRSCSRRREDVMMFLPSLSKMESSDDDDGFGPRYLFLFCPCAKHDGVVLGVVSARRPNGVSNYIVTFIALFGYSAPVFWTGILLLITFSLNVHWFPVAGMRDVTIEGGFWVHFLDVARHLIRQW